MIDFFCIFSTGGLILWFKQFATFNIDLINLLIRNILMDEKRNQDYYTVDGIIMRWKVVNDKGLIFTVTIYLITVIGCLSTILWRGLCRCVVGYG